ncbi:DUF6036 family nucleotidyltransferase [Patulibacter sp. NPDC049589]|uniref:DUF6036 family nucleotidyltransferase n=1 Tax=Patulibacter sp. NPDC049589 TaxID=3154731 RepID=UPI003447B611
MSPAVDAERVRDLARFVASRVDDEATLYLVGGTTAVIEGWRASTLDIDLYVEPDLDAVARAIADARRALDVYIEYAWPAQFVPELDGWRDRSPAVMRVGTITVRHYDPYSQALAKLRRAHAQDLADVAAMIANGLVVRHRARELFASVFPRLFRYPSVDARALQQMIDTALAD